MTIESATLNRNEVTTTPSRKEISEVDFSWVAKSIWISSAVAKSNAIAEKRERSFIEWELAKDLSSIFNISHDEEKLISKKQLSKEEIEKIELSKQAKFASLAYSEFYTEKDNWWPIELKDLKIRNIALDPIWFPNLKKMTSWKDFNRKDLSFDERLLLRYMNTPEIMLEAGSVKMNPDTMLTQFWSDVEEILALANMWIRPWDMTMFADWSSEESVNAEMSQKMSSYKDKLYNRNLISLSLERVRKDKVVENWNMLQDLQKEYWQGIQVLNYFPKWKESSPSWFRAICLQDVDWSKIFAIAWTEVKSFWDFFKDFQADMSLVFKRLPESQSIDMIRFVSENLWENEKFKVYGHSLWWTLAEVLWVMYTKVKKWEGKEVKYEHQATYVKSFNSPWAKWLSVPSKPEVNDDDLNKDVIFDKFRDFWYNNGKEWIWENMTSVRWDKWISPIAWLWEHVADNEIRLRELSSHWIADCIKEIDRTEPSKLKEQKVRERVIVNENPID